jgi:formylglycine-generating enzyme required for sulfatase activity
VEFFFSPDGADSFPVICTAVTGDTGPGVEPSEVTYIDGFLVPGAMHSEIERKQATWDASVDWDQNFTDRGRIMIKATYGNQPTGFPGLDINGSEFGPGNPAPTHIVPSADNLEMIWVDPGSFVFGSPLSEAGRDTDEVEHNVTLTEGYYLGKFELTQGQYEAVMTGHSGPLSHEPSGRYGSPSYQTLPVENVSWHDVQVFLSRLNNLESANIPAGWAYVLPTEAQWEYACRAGTNTAYPWGDDINSSFANYNWDGGWDWGNDVQETMHVGQFPPNAWGFYDMHANVAEWTADLYGNYPNGSVTDPTGDPSGSWPVVRGGSWKFDAMGIRSAKRVSHDPSSRFDDFGFRLALIKIQ